MVAEGDDIRAGGEKRDRHFGCQAKTVGGVFGVYHHEIGVELRTQAWKGCSNRVPAGAAHQVA